LRRVTAIGASTLVDPPPLVNGVSLTGNEGPLARAPSPLTTRPRNVRSLVSTPSERHTTNHEPLSSTAIDGVRLKRGLSSSSSISGAELVRPPSAKTCTQTCMTPSGMVPL
jgi:hypothetical protein